jgi:hypothetical protein
MAGPGQKFIHLVDAELSQNAQFKSFDEIPAHALNWGTTIRFLPGVYEMGTLNNVDNLTFEGVGNPADVVLANLVLANTTANTNNFRNLTLSGNSGAAASTGRSLMVNNGATGTLRFRDVIFTRGDFGIDNQAAGVSLLLEYCDASGVDRALRSNAAASTNVRFSVLNASANAYFTGANATAKAIQIVASQSGGSNTGNTTRTVTALLS